VAGTFLVHPVEVNKRRQNPQNAKSSEDNQQRHRKRYSPSLMPDTSRDNGPTTLQRGHFFIKRTTAMAAF
jgi:hypothetical protein